MMKNPHNFTFGNGQSIRGKFSSDRGVEKMKSKAFILAAIFSLIAFPSASAEETKITGEATVTGQLVDLKGQEAKFNEYRDIHSGITGGFELQYEREAYYVDLSGREVGRKDQGYSLFGGRWGSFRYEFRYDEIPHNFTTNAKTFYSGFGGANLTYSPQPPSTFLPNTNFTTWNSFDYSIERKNYDGGFRLDMLKPFFFGVSVAREERRGILPIGAAGTSPGGIALELPSPLNYQTDILKLEAGYLKAPLSLAIHYYYGQFQNDNSNLNFRDPATANTAATTDAFTLPPDNNYFKFDFKGALKLPWNSKFNADLSYSRNESNKNLLNSYVSDVTAAASNIGVQGRTGITLNEYVFNGKVDIQNYVFVLTTNPIYFLDGKVFYRYYQTRNKSDQIITTDSTESPATFSNEERLFDYSTYKLGAQVGFKLPMSFYLIAGYTRGHISRKREDIPRNDDDLYETELRWSGVDFMVARVGYERLHRRADFEAPQVTGPTDPAIIEYYVRRFDGAGKEQDVWKINLDFFPAPDLNISLGYKWRDTRYKDTILGLQSWAGHEYHVDADYLVLKRVKLYGYFDYEYGKLDQKQRTFTSGTNANPALPPSPTAFNWTVTETDRNYVYGLGTDVYALPKKLTFTFQYSYVKSRGSADYTYLLGLNPIPPTRTQDNIDINDLDSYSLRYYLAKVTYTPVKPLSLSLGWAYEKYIYDDAQFNGYQYVPLSSTGGTLGFLTGAYANQNYRANIYFASASYHF
jgi:MtrB/PioB family decaheme-associated outer membrane protein